MKCYFLDNLINSTVKADAPEFGAASFYTNNTKLRGAIEIYVEGVYMGKIEGYYATGVLACNQQHTVTFMKKPGVYNYTAKGEKYSWQGTFEVKNGVCFPYLLFVK